MLIRWEEKDLNLKLNMFYVVVRYIKIINTTIMFRTVYFGRLG